ncbi:oxidoreductase [Streptomyces cadmiisoli]|uniref:Short-chain dehydrogenase/reductase n=1 Tax=Streptomyces cadmiisoli TaxID=2184053 RepID=A0A2Z4J9E3_9ACTN|nr:oxidoreductase [Streptomyces cadmiisoli]AWW41338.1 short-chain dehydrogenase/reductase [Streptomyces cadmiisoli]AWW41760.1 short-chain dehydrogenase/reductase [Streptomyces cadmiisoli]
MTTWFITGASRGFGLEIARQALEQGDRVVATARKPEQVEEALTGYGDRLLALALDVTDEAAAVSAVAAAVDAFGGIDVLVNNAGRGVLGAVEETSADAVRAVYDTNVFGLLHVTRAVLPVMRNQNQGHIINLSSIGGFSSVAGFGVYCSTKFAVEGLSEAMRQELAPLGVNVTIIEPGYFRTDFLDATSLDVQERTITDYAATSGAVRDAVPGLNHAQPGDPVKGAAAILAIAAAEAPPLRLQLGTDSADEMNRKVAQLRDEANAWRPLAVSTDHDEVPAQN